MGDAEACFCCATQQATQVVEMREQIVRAQPFVSINFPWMDQCISYISLGTLETAEIRHHPSRIEAGNLKYLVEGVQRPRDLGDWEDRNRPRLPRIVHETLRLRAVEEAQWGQLVIAHHFLDCRKVPIRTRFIPNEVVLR